MRRVDVRAIGRERTRAEKLRRHIHGDKGARFSQGRYGILMGGVMGAITTLAAKDNILAEIYETH